jgi:GAF domain-containing protein/HAMP domain-containing protein
MNLAQSKPKPGEKFSFFQSRSLRARLLATSIALALTPVLVVGIIATLISSQGLRSEVFNQLEIVVTLKENQVLSWLQSLQTNLDLVVAAPDTLTNVSTLVTNPDSEDADPTQVRNTLTSYKERSGYFTEIFIMDMDGRVVMSTDEDQEGKILKTQSFFHQGLNGPNITPPSYELSLQNYSIVVSQPLLSRAGRVIGVLAGRANLDTLNEIMIQRARLGNTGETYVVNSNNAVLTSLRFEEITLGQTYINTQGVVNVVQQKENGSATYEDYRGEPVVGVYHWIPELQIAVMAEQDQAEAFTSVNRLIQVTIGLFVVTALIAILAAYLISQSITSPISKLAQAAQEISRGNLEQKVEIVQQDEIGVLADSFNTMTTQLREFIATLEQRVADRTKALALTAQVSRSLSTILNQNQLVSEVVEQVKKSFDYYHAHIYLFDKEKANLVMAGGTGEVGKTLLAQGHKIPKGQGLVGRAAERNEPVLVSNTLQDKDWLPNPLLPETAAEAAIPISIGDNVIGVLDVQHNIVDGLQNEDIGSLQSIANQVAIAYQNIQQYENSQKVANDLSVVAQVGIATATITNIDQLLQEVVDLSKKSFNLYHAHIYMLNEAGNTLELAAGADEVGRKMVAEGRSIPMSSEQSIVARAAQTRQGVVVNDVAVDSNFLPNPLLPDTHSELAVPMIVNNRVIGVLDVQSENVGRFTEVDVNIKTTLASQIAVAVQNARNFEQSKRRAERETAVNLIAQRIQNTTSVENALQVAARELGHALGKRQTLVVLDPSTTEDNSKEN